MFQCGHYNKSTKQLIWYACCCDHIINYRFSQGKFLSFNYQFAKRFNTDDFDYNDLTDTDFVFMRWKVSGSCQFLSQCHWGFVMHVTSSLDQLYLPIGALVSTADISHLVLLTWSLHSNLWLSFFLMFLDI